MKNGTSPFARSNLRPVVPVFFYGFGIFTLRVLQFQHQFATTCRSSLWCFIGCYVKTPSTGCFLTYPPSLAPKIKPSERAVFLLKMVGLNSSRGFDRRETEAMPEAATSDSAGGRCLFRINPFARYL